NRPGQRSSLDRTSLMALGIPQHRGSSNQKESTGSRFSAGNHVQSGGRVCRVVRCCFAMVARSNCTAYDCEFVALAQAEGVQLVTADRQILHEFPDAAISLEKFVRE